MKLKACMKPEPQGFKCACWMLLCSCDRTTAYILKSPLGTTSHMSQMMFPSQLRKTVIFGCSCKINTQKYTKEKTIDKNKQKNKKTHRSKVKLKGSIGWILQKRLSVQCIMGHIVVFQEAVFLIASSLLNLTFLLLSSKESDGYI